MLTSVPCSKALWPLVSSHPLPRIHLLSDLHLETGPYEIPSGLEFDILVAAGDVGPIEIAVPWLAALNKPVVYVLGNHERWGRSFDGAVAEARAAAKGTKVHVLERNQVVIQGVRFLGATLWTSYGNWHSGLVKTATAGMRDYNEIDASNWYASLGNVRWMRSMLRRIEFRVPPADECEKRTKFHPVVAYQLHLKTTLWLKKRLSVRFDGPTVVVTHHAPSFASLRAMGISEGLLDPDNWNNRDDELIRVGCYASPRQLRLGSQGQIDMWLHGHIHSAIDVLDEATRVVCNPRGRHIKPISEGDAKGLAFFGLNVTQDDIAASEALLRKHPFRGEVHGFDPSLILDFEDGYRRPLAILHDSMRAELRRHILQAKEAAAIANRQSRVGGWARRCFEADVHAFRELIRTFLHDIEGALWSGSTTSPHLPNLPLPPIDGLFEQTSPSSAFMNCVQSMELCARWAQSVPTLAAKTLHAWVQTGVRILDVLESQFECKAWLLKLPVRALRALDSNDFRVVVESQIEDNDILYAKVIALVQAQKDTLGTFRATSLRPLSDCSDAERARLLSRETLRAVLACHEAPSHHRQGLSAANRLRVSRT